MSADRKFLKCSKCHMVIQDFADSADELSCCGIPMDEVSYKEARAHLPMVVPSGDKTVVRVGSPLHPKSDDHYIEWIELGYGDKRLRKVIGPGEEPEVELHVKVRVAHEVESYGCDTRVKNRVCYRVKSEDEVHDATVSASCNVHGLWRSRGTME